MLVRRSLAALLFATLAASSSAAVAAPARAEASSTATSTSTPVMQRDQVSARQIAGWFAANQPRGSSYRGPVPVAELAELFISEGRAEGVAGDLAFAQSVLETGWFRWPSHGQVSPTHNNFSGIGACDGGTCTVARFRSPRIGVRAQIQHLRAYADRSVTAAKLAYPLESPRFHLVTPKGKAPTWERMGGGNWATDPAYGSKILSLHRSMLAYARANPDPSGGPKPTTRFADVPAGHRNRGAIETLAGKGVILGCTATTFCPEAPVTRGQMASLLVRSFAIPAAPASSTTLRDATGTHGAAIRAIFHAGITDGCTPERFCGDADVTRGQIAVFLQRTLRLPDAWAPFSDVGANRHRRAIGAVAERGLVAGYPDGTFRPEANLTRSQLAAVLDRALAER